MYKYALFCRCAPVRGFTLVELAVVMVIIGFLMGAVMQGWTMLQNARINGTIQQAQQYEAAAKTFRDSYGDLPGDMPAASLRLANCGTECNPAGGGASGNKIVGRQAWSTGWATQYTQLGASNTDETAETMLFWMHMERANMITGTATRAGVPNGIWSLTNPPARTGGGFIAGYVDDARPPGMPGAVAAHRGHFLAIVMTPETVINQTAGVQPLTPGQAAMIDRKMDNGRPDTGAVIAYGVAANCFAASGADFTYAEQAQTKDCGLMFRFTECVTGCPP